MILLKKNIKLTKDFSEKDYFTSFSVPRGIKKISLLFSYSPDQVTDRSLFSQSVSEAIKKYYGEFDGKLDQLKVENFDTIKNLLTISLDCNGRFIGNRHKWESNQTIEISKNKVTPGFISPHMIEGEWGVTIHCHQIFTELVNVELKVVGSMMKWHAVELHTHTYHSDGDFTLDELVETVQSLDFSAVCLTDHNTFSGYDEFEKALQKYQFIGVKGIEWTTYFGHLLVLGEEGKCDWRQSKKNNLDASLRAIHESGGISGIAHPYALSTPINTGYDFQFNIEDYSLVDFIEVWSRDFPEGKVRTIRAFKLWEEKLNQGYKITGTSGRDYHRADGIPVSYGNTYIGIDIQQILDSTQIVKAIKKGRIVVTLGPLLTAQIEKNDQVYEVGDVINPGRSLIKIQIDSKKNIGKWQIFDIKPKEIKFIHNGKIIYETNYEEEHEILLNLEKGWLRVDLIGEYLGVENSRLAFTNPFYIE